MNQDLLWSLLISYRNNKSYTYNHNIIRHTTVATPPFLHFFSVCALWALGWCRKAITRGIVNGHERTAKSRQKCRRQRLQCDWTDPVKRSCAAIMFLSTLTWHWHCPRIVGSNSSNNADGWQSRLRLMHLEKLQRSGCLRRADSNIQLYWLKR